ncbi:MAG: Ig-like domain-containing protein, partial [Defluviitaleaceae bacterium]|nr:Ig-like domain-containing protein [Defluviitaleaceae bacterium]
MKKAIAGILALALLITAIIVALPSPADITGPVRVIAAPVPREGYIIEPTIQGLSGVDTASAFTLTAPGSSADIPEITIDNQPPPAIERTGSNTFLITPTAPLNPNSLYIFRLERQGAEALTWAFQTTVRFQVTSNLPGNLAVNVPVNTGIEITFTSSGHTDITEYFNIYPPAEGRFISRGATTIFMPLSPLAHQQLYTVTLRAGVGLPGTNEILESDHVFYFETAAADGSERNWERMESIRFPSRYIEFPTFEPPQVRFNRNASVWGEALPLVSVSVYRLNSREAGLQASRQLVNAPRWTQFAWQNSLIDTRGLTQVMNFEIAERQGTEWFETMELPEALPHGFYLINATVGEVSDQVLLQITDLAVQIVADNARALLWVNNMAAGQPAAGAQVHDHIASNMYTADEEGIVFIERQLDREENITIVADGKEISLFLMSGSHHVGHWWGGTAVDEDYWTVLQLDRTLFQRRDTLYFWGFVQNRDGQSSDNIQSVTVTLTQGGWWGMRSRDILHRQTIPVAGGIYFGQIQLPHLDPGSYNLIVNHGDTILGSMFFSVEDFVKPPYDMQISADRRAIFAGEEITFTTRAEFFEGTPVAELPINYDMWSWGLSQASHSSGQGVTSQDGEFSVTLRPQASGAVSQGRVGLEFSASATLPEVGLTTRWHNIDVFLNDIDIAASASRTGENASITVDVHNITLERINDGTSQHWGDFLCAPAEGQVLDVDIYRIYWVPIRDGEFYCFIERRVIPRYNHERREEVLSRFQITTDSEGVAQRDFTVPGREYESYHARISTTDGNGRTIEHSTFIGRDWGEFLWQANDNTLFLYNPRERGATYDIGDEVVLTVKRGTEAVTRGTFLFVAMQGGILHYQVGAQNPFAFTFAEEHVPNATVYAFYFNGHTYHAGWNMNQQLRFASESKALQIHVNADSDTYRPGDISNMSITVTDMDGNPRAANINISVVDE